MNKKSVRKAFRIAVFKRAKYRCEVCGVEGVDRQDKNEGNPLDAHHIGKRELMPNGGYVLSNGISLCSTCHLSAEVNIDLPMNEEFSPTSLYKKIGSSYEKAYKDSEKL